MVRFRVPPSAGRTMEHEPSLSRQASAGRTSAVALYPGVIPHSPAGDELCPRFPRIGERYEGWSAEPASRSWLGVC